MDQEKVIFSLLQYDEAIHRPNFDHIIIVSYAYVTAILLTTQNLNQRVEKTT